jgi:hypothetical protein
LGSWEWHDGLPVLVLNRRIRGRSPWCIRIIIA